MEIETSMLLVNPEISTTYGLGLPYLDWGAMQHPKVAELYRRRLGVGTTELAPAERDDLGEMGNTDILLAWQEFTHDHDGATRAYSTVATGLPNHALP
jgi:hypothetical protein